MRYLRLRALGCASIVLAPLGCTSDPSPSSDTGLSSGEATSGSTTLEATSSSIPTTDSAGTSADETSMGIPDLGSDAQCNIYAQDCPQGTKCMPWDGGMEGPWSTWGCKPLAEDPAGVGEPCHAERSRFSGIDDCELGAMCWDVDRMTLEGICRDFCMGTSEVDAYCKAPDTLCEVTTTELSISVCTPVCDPLAQDCPAGEACYFVSSLWQCASDASGDAGAYGDPCQFVPECDPGLICVGAGALPRSEPCHESIACCTEVCDLSMGDMQCAGAAGGQICVPWYEEGEAPPGYEQVGVCMVPP